MPNPVNPQFAQALQQYMANHNATRVVFVGDTAVAAPGATAPAPAAAAPASVKPADTRELQRITGTPNRNCSAGVFKTGEKS